MRAAVNALVRARWRVVRQSTGADVCQHRWERAAYWCARRYTRREANGVFFDVREAVDRG